MAEKLPLTGLVLAGGLSRRMGRPKACLDLGGRTLAGWVVDAMSEVCREVVIVTARPVDFLEFKEKVVRDLIPGQGPLGGLATGFFYSSTPWVLAAACDIPFLKADVLRIIGQKALSARGGPRALAPRTKDGWQPLVAAYSRECLGSVRKILAAGGHKVDDLRFHGVAWESVDAELFRAVDPDLISFLNINTPEDLEIARARLAQSD
ncbi:MAG: molybdenum cofactor guanylyltransferase [Pseudomonadota bacterium]